MRATVSELESANHGLKLKAKSMYDEYAAADLKNKENLILFCRLTRCYKEEATKLRELQSYVESMVNA